MANATVKGDFLFCRLSDGSIEQGHRVDDGDRITVIDISYSKQLVRCSYPVSGGVRASYVKNACIAYDNDHSLYVPCLRYVFDINSGAQIGSVENEHVTVLADYGNGKINIAYDTDKGKNSKSGYIWKWNGNDSQPQNQDAVQFDSSLVSDSLVNFVKSYEGFIDHAYDDSTGVMTIGYGTTRKDLVALGHCTEEQATSWLKDEINNMAIKIKADLDSKGVSLNQNQFDALCSFAYNCGVDALLNQSNLYKRVCDGVRDESLRQNFLAWCNAGGKKLQGLYNRRTEETDIFLKGDYVRNL